MTVNKNFSWELKVLKLKLEGMKDCLKARNTVVKG